MVIIRILFLQLFAVIIYWIPFKVHAGFRFCAKIYSDQQSIYRIALDKYRSSVENIDANQVRNHLSNFLNMSGYSVAFKDKALNKMLLGLLGEVYSIKVDSKNPKKAKMILVPDVEAVALYRSQYANLLSKAEPADEVIIRKHLIELLTLTKLNDSVAARYILNAKLVGHQYLSGFEQAVLHRFQMIGMQTVDFVYRSSALEPSEHQTGATMMDEVRSIIKQARGYSIHLVYDKQVLEFEIKLLSVLYRQWLSAKDEKLKDEIILKVNQGGSPFLPSSGVVTTEFIFPNGIDTELKRYFQNPIPDVLGMLQLKPVNENSERLAMLKHVISHLDPMVTLEIHAHSEVHKKAYERLGFVNASETENPLYPGTKIYILKGQKEQVLEKINVSLARLSKAD